MGNSLLSFSSLLLVQFKCITTGEQNAVIKIRLCTVSSLFSNETFVIAGICYVTKMCSLICVARQSSSAYESNGELILMKYRSKSNSRIFINVCLDF